MLELGNLVKVFATRGSDRLGAEICAQGLLTNQLQEGPISLSNTGLVRFSNENLQAQPENIRGHFAVVIHTQTPPVNEHLVELFALLNSIKNAHPEKILLVFPYMPYSRSDRKNKPRISTMAKVVAGIVSKVFEIPHVLLLDPHDSHIKHYFDPDADEVTAIYLILDYFEREFFPLHDKGNCVVVFPDSGASKRFEDVPSLLKLPHAYIDKHREDDTENPEPIGVVGDVRGKTCIMFDDELLTGGTAMSDARFLRRPEFGASAVFMVTIHAPLMKKGVLDEVLIAQLENPESGLDGFVFTNSIPVEHKVQGHPRVRVLSVARLLAEAIRREVSNESVSDLYEPEMVRLYRTPI